MLSGDLRHFYEPPRFSLAHAVQRPPQRAEAPTLKSWLGAPADVFQHEVLEHKHGGSMNPRARRSAAATCARPQKTPTTRRGGGLSVLAKRSLLNPPGNEPNTCVGEADLISHRNSYVQVAPIDVRPAVDHRDVVGTPACVTHRKLGSKRQGAVRRTPRRGRHYLSRGRVGSWH